MSYRNPQIIVDRSAEIYAGMATAGANMFNAYMDARAKANERAKKQDAGLLKALNKERENQQVKIDEGVDVAGGINGAGGLVKAYKSIYQDEAETIIPLNAKMNLGQTSGDESKSIREQENNLDSWSGRTVDHLGNYGSQAETYSSTATGSFANNYVINGDTPNEKLANKMALNLASNSVLLDGAEARLFFEDKNTIKANGRIKVGSAAYEAYKESGFISDEDEGEDGYINFEWKADTRNSPRQLYSKKIEPFNIEENLEQENLIKDGVVTKNFFTDEPPVYSKPIDMGNNKQFYQTVKRYIDIDKIFQGGFGDVVDSWVGSITGSDQSMAAQLDLIKSMGGPELIKKYREGTDRDNIITTDIETKAIQYLTGGKIIQQDENGRYYTLDETKPQMYRRDDNDDGFDEKDSKPVNLERIETFPMEIEVDDISVIGDKGVQEKFTAIDNLVSSMTTDLTGQKSITVKPVEGGGVQFLYGGSKVSTRPIEGLTSEDIKKEIYRIYGGDPSKIKGLSSETLPQMPNPLLNN
jgi:hypothetical protein